MRWLIVSNDKTIDTLSVGKNTCCSQSPPGGGAAHCVCKKKDKDTDIEDKTKDEQIQLFNNLKSSSPIAANFISLFFLGGSSHI